MATYRYLFADLRSNEILAELPLTGVTFTQVLNNTGTLNARLQISDIREEGYDIEGVTIPARTSLYVERDGVLVWGGVIWLRNYNSVRQTMEFSAREFESYLEKRRITETKVFQNVDQLTIAQDLINEAQAQIGGDVGFIVNNATSGILVSRVFFDYEYKDLFAAIKDLSSAQDGFDFAVDVAYDSFNEPQKYFNFAYPQRGVTYSESDPNALVFEFPGNIVEYEWPDDGSVIANTMYGIGPNSNEAKLRVTANAPDPKIAEGWPILEDTTNYNDVYDINLLQQLADGEVAARQDPVVTMKITLPAYVSPVLGSYQTGDECLVRITDARWPAPAGGGFGYAGVQRIVAISVQPGEDGPERVTLTMTTPTLGE